MGKTYDAVVVGAGVFGAWTAWHLLRAGQRVLLVDKYGPASARASSGGETRVIRMAYGPDEIYTRMSQQSLLLWKEFFARIAKPGLFRETGVLWLAAAEDASAAQVGRSAGPDRHPAPGARSRRPRAALSADRDSARRLGHLRAG